MAPQATIIMAAHPSRMGPSTCSALDMSHVQPAVDRREPRGKRYTATGGGVSKSTDFDHARVFSQKPATQHILRRNSKPGSRQNASNNTGAGSNNALMSNSSVNDFRSHRAGATEIIEQQRICAPKSDAEASRSVSVNAGCDNAAARAGGVFGSGSSFGSVMPDKPASVGRSTWNSSKFKGSWCCDCVPLSRTFSGGPAVGAPETYEGGASGSVSSAGPAVEAKSVRPHHRRGHSTGSIKSGARPGPLSAHTSQPQGWEDGSIGAGSASTSAASSNVSAALATAAASLGPDDGAASVVSGGRRSGTWGSSTALDRELHRVLKAGVDVYKHPSAVENSGQWADVVPKRLKGLWSRKCPLGDESQGLVTIFFDKNREFICWCTPGAAELVPDERYRLAVSGLTELTPGDKLRPRFLSLRATGRQNPLVFEVDSNEMFETLSKGFARILEKNQVRNTLLADPSTAATL